MQRPELPLQAGHPIATPGTGLLTPPWVIFFQHLIRYVHEAALVPVDLGSETTGRLDLAGLPLLSGPAVLLGRGASGPGPTQELTLGPGLTMTGTVLDTSALGVAAKGYWTPITNGDPLSPEGLFDAIGDCVVGFVPTGGAP